MTSEQIKLRGEVSIRGYNERNELVYKFDKQNMVVTTGKQVMAGLLAAPNADYVIDGIGFGSSAAAPALTDTALTAPYTIDGIGASSFPTPNSVRWEWVLDYASFNGNTIRELGLFSGLSASLDILFARIATDPIAKTSSLRLEGSWKITF